MRTWAPGRVNLIGAARTGKEARALAVQPSAGAGILRA